MTDKAAVLAELARVVAHEGDKPLAVRLCQACARILGADGGAITLDYTQQYRVTLCVTDHTAARLEDLQEVLGEGPGPDAYRSGQVVIAALAESSADRWEMFADAAREAVGAVTIYALPMRPGSDLLGVLTLYQSPARPMTHGIAVAQFLADAVGAALLRDPGSQGDLGAGPWESRAHIHQATGMVVAQLRVNPDDALALLRAHAFAHETTLDDIAHHVIERRLDFSTNEDSSGNET